MNLHELINADTATIVDVRTRAEFLFGHVPGAVNIPLNSIPGKIEELKKMSKPVIFCCASGARSGQATMYSQQMGVTEAYNGGAWSQVRTHRMNKV